MAAPPRPTKDAVLEEALGLFDTEDYERIAELLRAPELVDDPDAIYILGCALGTARQFHEALAVFERLVELEDGRGPAAVAQTLWNGGQLDEALPWYERAVEIGDSEGELEYSRALLALNRTEAAVAHLQVLITLNDAIGDEAAGLLGSVLAFDGRRSAAVIALLTRGQDAEPDAKAWLGTYALRDGNERVGITLLERATDAGSAQASIVLGNHYVDSEEFERARRAYQPGADSGDDFAKFNLGALLYFKFPRRRAEALRLIRAAAASGDRLAKKWIRSH